MRETFDMIYADSLADNQSILPNYADFNKTTLLPYFFGLGISECQAGYAFDPSTRTCLYC